VIQTCRMQGRDPIEFLTQAIRAYRKGLPAASLLPTEENQLKKAA